MINWDENIGKNGPDFFMNIWFPEDDDVKLHLAARTIEMDGFVRYVLFKPKGNWWEVHWEEVPDDTVGAVDWYFDSIHSQWLLLNYTGQRSKNIWNYRTIEVARCKVKIEHGFGSSSESCMASEMKLIAALANMTNPPLQKWSIIAGGQGYGDVDIASGSDRESLKDYLEII